MDILTPAVHSFRGEGLNYETGYGLIGGSAGAAGKMHLRYRSGKTEEAPKFGLRQTEEVHFVTQSPGGGGYGSPLDRDPELVLRDWRDGIISENSMRKIYGVIPAEDKRTVDLQATRTQRRSI